MTFLNWTMLIGLAAVAIPILIHLLNRRRARLIDWGAMGFLLASLAARSRRILIEEIILLALRCLVMALAALAVARPFLPSRPSALWVLFVPAVVLAALAFSLAAAMWGERRLRRGLLAVGAALLAVPLLAGLFERVYQQSRWSFGGGQKDVAVVIDASASMSLRWEGRTNFQRAVEEARAVLGACQRSDGVAVILAGPSPQAVVSRPTTDRREVEIALAAAAPAGGTMRVGPALRLASHVLMDGANPARKIVLITDGQDAGWDVRAESQWRQLGSALAAHPARPQIILRSLELPKTIRNLALTDMTFDRAIVGTDRPLEVQVRAENSGTEPLAAQTVRLLVDGEQAAAADIDRILPNSSETLRFRVRLERPGRHVVTAATAGGDDLPADDSIDRVVDALPALPVLIVDGAPSRRALEGAGEYLSLALAPPEPAAARHRDANAAPGCLVHPRLVAAGDLAAVKDLGAYAAVILADVPMLPDAAAARLARFVTVGGGLLVAPGKHASPTFYNAWADQAGQHILPARLVKLDLCGDQPRRLATDGLRHPAVEKLADARASDVRSAALAAYWHVKADVPDAAVIASLAGGEPFLLERTFGRGRVVLAATALHPSCTNLPSLKCFVPLVHEMTYWLAASGAATANIPAGADAVIELPARRPSAAAPAASAPAASAPAAIDRQLVVVTPTGQHRLAAVIGGRGGPLRLSLEEVRQPGLHRLLLPPGLRARYAALCPDGQSVPFAVVYPPGESTLSLLSDADLSLARQHVLEGLGAGDATKMLVRVESTAELAAAVAGGVPGRELWRYVALALLAALLAEIALTRHIAAQRKAHGAEPVAFGQQGLEGGAFGLRARQMLRGRQGAEVIRW